ncbi:C-type lectin domain family 10 member A-like [Eucyclogobius newberryi]|uniref:C-type lectin domain family 10 member A-like n=1 Tax=Eucyclogobius newberryi TaxID=166745 RepID=UPI003B5C55AE
MGRCQICFSASEDLEYHFIKEPKTWEEAQTFCRKFYTDLAKVKNMKELERLRAAADGGTDVWIGLHQTSDQNKKWHWSQPEVQYNEGEAEWKEGQPDDEGGVENCVIRQFDVKYPTRYHYWFGLSRDSWSWSDRSDSSFRNWNSDVNPLKHKCAALRAQGRWESDTCDLKKPFICHGGLKTRKMLFKIKMSSSAGDFDSLKPLILERLYNHLRANDLTDFKLRWKTDEDDKDT